MKNFIKLEKQEGARIELHNKLNLTGSEISINVLPANGAIPFIHSHKQNEEVYFIIKGSGKFVVDGEEIYLSEGDFIKIDPVGKRQIFASENGISYLCIQSKVNSLEGYTLEDAIVG